jgi:hypothetical protein
MLFAIAVGVVGSFYLVFKIAGAVMKVLFFAVAFAIGFGLAWGGSLVTGHPEPLWVYAFEGLAFAWVLNIIRAKIARAITAALLLVGTQVYAWIHHQTTQPTPTPHAHHAKAK